MLKLNNDIYKLSSIDLLKFFGVISMTFSHCFFFIYRLKPDQNFFFDDSFWGKTLFYNGFNSLVLPCLAGVSFYETMNPYFRAGEFRNVPVLKIFRLLVILAFIESIKNFLTFGLSAAFHWEVLHFISLSFALILIILVLGRLKNLVQITFGFILLNVALDIGFKNSYVFSNDLGMSTYGDFQNIILIVSLFLLCFWLFFEKHIHFIKKIILTLAFMFLVSVTLYFNFISRDVFVSLYNLPLSIFVQIGQIGGHIWPLFPWFVLVSYGFLLHYAVTKNIFKHYQLIALYIFCYIAFIYFYFFNYDSYRLLLNKDHFFTSGFFKPNSYILFLLLCFYTCIYSLYHFVFKYVRLKNRIVKETADGILIYYFIHIFIAWKLLPSFIIIIPEKWLPIFYPIAIFLITYTFVSAYLFFSKKRMQVSVARR